jgi:FtsX-like permease family
MRYHSTSRLTPGSGPRLVARAGGAVRALLAGWSVSLRRSRVDWPIVAAAGLITLLAATLLASGPIYTSAASLAGLRRTLADAPVAATTIEVSAYDAPGDAVAVDSRVEADLEAAIAPLSGTIVRDVRSSATMGLPGGPLVGPRDQAMLGFLDGLPDHATLVGGTWPHDRAGSGPIEVVVVDAVARALQLSVGDQLSLAAHQFGREVPIPVRLVGIFTIDAPGDPYWYSDSQLINGIVQTGSDRTFGPFLTTSADLLAEAGITSVHLLWRVYPAYDQLTVDAEPSLRSSLEALPAVLRADTPAAPYVTTGLPTILADAQRSLLVSRAAMLLLMAQLGIMAGYAITLIASLLVDHRRTETALLRSRGAATSQLVLLALAEGLVLAIPAVLLAPWLAVAAVTALDLAGPLAAAGLDIVPQVNRDAYLLAAGAGIGCVALLVLPAVAASRGYAAEQHDISRQEVRPFAQRVGFDVALVGVAGIALWQLRLYAAPLTRTVEGSLGLDPLLVAAPALGLLAGGILALRILPLAAGWLETVVARGRGVVASLGSRQLARRPLRYTRSALLLMLALSMGVFALSYAATWSTSQRDQAMYQAGADVRLVPDRSSDGLPTWAEAAAYAGLPGVGQVSPVERDSGAIRFGLQSGDLLALDAATAAGVVLFRSDESATPLGDLMESLRAGRPEPDLATLPAGATYLGIVARLDVQSALRIPTGPIRLGEQLPPPQVLDPSTLTARVSASAVIRDGRGLLYRVQSGAVSIRGLGTLLALALQPTTPTNASTAAAAGARLSGPVQLVSVGLDLWLPDSTLASGVVSVVGVSTAGAPDGPWTELSTAQGGSWSAAEEVAGSRGSAGAYAPAPDLSLGFAGPGPQGAIIGFGTTDTAPLAARITFLPSSLASASRPVPVIANPAFLSATASAPGDTVTTTIEGVVRQVTIVGVVGSFPTTDPGRPLLIFDEPTLGLLRLRGAGSVRSPDEWWLAAPGGAAAMATVLRGPPFDDVDVVTAVDRARSLTTDPVALGAIGALSLGFVATGLFAILGLAVSSAISARQRRTEFALMRALGLSGRQLQAWLWLENGSLVLVSLVAGTALGLFIGWLVLPFVSVTQQATAPIPAVVVEVPWGQIGLLEVVSGLSLGVAVALISWLLRRLGVGSVLRMGED